MYVKRNPRPPQKDLSGQTFGYLLVLKMAQTSKSKRGHWRCVCLCNLCGKEDFDARPFDLRHKRVISCGCSKDRYKKMTGKNSKLFKGYEEIPGRTWYTIKARAAKRSKVFDISIEYVWNLFIAQNKKCALSGLDIRFGQSNRKNIETTASLDRIDNKKGYVVGNVQWVHKTVNIMKNVYDQDHFISMCERITKFNSKNFR